MQQRRIFLIFTLVSVFCGIRWGYSNKKVLAPSKTQVRMTVLAPSNFASTTIGKAFKSERDIHIDYITYENDEELFQKATLPWDVALVGAAQMDQLRRENLLQSWHRNKIENTQNLSPDFYVSVLDPTGETAIPLFWGVSEGQLWMENLVISSKTDQFGESHELANFLLRPEMALALSRDLKLPGVNRELEKVKELSPQLKPSYLRDLKRTDVSFSAAVEASM